MAATKFFKKPSPSDPVILSNGQVLKFPTVNFSTGYFATDLVGLQMELIQLINANRFGLSEVSWSEYDSEYLKKKNGRPSRRLWREEISGTKHSPNPFLELNAGPAAAANRPQPRTGVPMLEPEATVAPERRSTDAPPTPELRLNVGRR